MVWKIRQRCSNGCERCLRRGLNRFDVWLRDFLDRVFTIERVLKVNLHDHTFRLLPFAGQETVAFDGLSIDVIALVDRRLERIVREQIRPNLSRFKTPTFVRAYVITCFRMDGSQPPV